MAADLLPLIGSVRGFRWWRVGSGEELLSPWRGPIRWDPGENEAACLGRRGMLGWKSSRAPHPRGSPAAGCECGFYALHSLPELNEEPGRSIWEIDADTSGGRHGLVLGVVEGYGRALIGTAGWRARFGRVLALFRGVVAPDLHRGRLDDIAVRYQVPLYRNLPAMAAEWGPDRDVVERLTA
jgi:hypothetical protein